MIPKNVVFKSFLPPGLTTFNGVTYVVPGWHIVPEGTTLEEVKEHWIPEYPRPEKSNIIQELVKSNSSNENYVVEYNGFLWKCTCVGFGFRGTCKHIEQIKLKHNIS